MNRIIKSLFIVMLAVSPWVDAQFRTRDRIDNLEGFDNKKYSWGFFLNLNNYDYKMVLDPTNGIIGNQNAVQSQPTYSFGAGLIGKRRLSEDLDLRLEPGLQFTERELTFENARLNAPNPDDTSSYAVRKIKSTYLDIPLLLEYHGWRWYNSRPYISGGINWMVNLQSNEGSEDDNQQALFRSTTHNFGWSAEMGIQFYFGGFKLTPAVRGTFILNNELVADNPGTPAYWAGSLSGIHSRVFMFILKFE